jgi:hypothetical protein
MIYMLGVFVQQEIQVYGTVHVNVITPVWCPQPSFPNAVVVGEDVDLSWVAGSSGETDLEYTIWCFRI